MGREQNDCFNPPLGKVGSQGGETSGRLSKFEAYGEEMIAKVVRKSGSSGRVYLPPEWIGKSVKVIRID